MLCKLFENLAAWRLSVGSNSCLVDEVDADAELQARGESAMLEFVTRVIGFYSLTV